MKIAAEVRRHEWYNADMKLTDSLKRYEDRSGKLSDIARQLSLAALGIVWLFKSGTGPSYTIPHELLSVAAWAVIALSLDFCQYLYAALFWGWFNRHMEKRLEGNQNAEFGVWPEANWPTIMCFYGKLLATLATYAILLRREIPSLLH